MYLNSRPKTLLVILLTLSLVATGCSAQWINVALADLPVLVQMALNIGTVVTTLESGKQLSSSETAAIQNISNEAGKDLSLLQTLYNQYKASPSSDTIQKIQSTIADINQNLPALLTAAHISDPALSTRVTAAVNLIITTVNSFAALMPQPSATARVAYQLKPVPHAEDLKRQWNQQICGVTESAPNSSPAGCPVK